MFYLRSILYLFMILLSYLIPFFLIKIIFYSVRKNKSQNYFKNNIVNYSNSAFTTNISLLDRYKDVSSDKLSRFNTDDIEVLKDYFYDLFLKFEIAYSNLDYNTMKYVSTKEVFHNYYVGINLNLKAGKRRIIENIKKNDVILFELDSSSIKQVATIMVDISYNNYVVDKENNIISGSRDNVITEKFEVSFRKDFGKNQITKCPNCGANITSSICDYCHTQVDNIEFRISSIKKIVEK